MSVLLPPVGAGLGGYQPVTPAGVSGQGMIDQYTNAGIKAVIGPSFKSYDDVIRNPAIGVVTAGNFGQAVLKDAPVEPITYVHSRMSEGLNELVEFFLLKSIHPTDKLIRTLTMVFNASRAVRVTDFTQGDQDMSTSFKTEAATIQVGKMAEIDVKVINTPEGRRMWFERLRQCANGFLTSIVIMCVNAVLDCAPEKLALTSANNMVAPFSVRIPFVEAVNHYIGQFNVIGRGPSGINDLVSILSTIQDQRDGTVYDVLVADTGAVNRMALGMAGWAMERLVVGDATAIPNGSTTRSYFLRHTGLKRVLEVGPVVIGPNTAKAPAFSANRILVTHQIIPADAADDEPISIFDRRLDRFVDLTRADLDAACVNLTGAAVNDGRNTSSYIIFTAYQGLLGNFAGLSTAARRPELHLSEITHATTLEASQHKLGFYAVMTGAAVVPDKTAVAFLNDTWLKAITRGGGQFVDSKITDETPLSFKNHRTRFVVRVRNQDIKGLQGDTSRLSMYGTFPGDVTNGEEIVTWMSNVAGANQTARAVAIAKMLEPVHVRGAVVPQSVINNRIAMPYLSTQDACTYTRNGVAKVCQPNGIFGKYAYEGCTADMCGAYGSRGYLVLPSTNAMRVNT